MTPQKKTDLVDKLKKLMIRHTKAQRIGGEAALSLPTLTAETEWLSFTPTEKKLYDQARQHALKNTKTKSALKSGSSVFPLMMGLAPVAQACAGVVDFASTFDKKSANTDAGGDRVVRKSKGLPVYERGQEGLRAAFAGKVTLAQVKAARSDGTKVKALEKDLKKLMKEDPSFHAVVFTQHQESHRCILRMVKGLGIDILSVSGGDSFESRHAAIREFQQGCATVQATVGGAGGAGGAGGKGGAGGAGARAGGRGG